MVFGVCIRRQRKYPEYDTFYDQRTAGYALESFDSACDRRDHRRSPLASSRNSRCSFDLMDLVCAWDTCFRGTFQLAYTCDNNRSGFVSSEGVILKSSI